MINPKPPRVGDITREMETKKHENEMETFEAFGIKLLGQNDLEASPNTNALDICNHLYRDTF